MPKITYVQPNGESRTVEVSSGVTLMEGALEHRIAGIDAACGGSCSCSTCHVHVDAEWFAKTGEPDEAEKDTLEFAIEPSATSRLSCQVEITDDLDGLVVRVADEQA